MMDAMGVWPKSIIFENLEDKIAKTKILCQSFGNLRKAYIQFVQQNYNPLLKDLYKFSPKFLPDELNEWLKNPTESAESSKTTAETKSNDPLQNKGIGPIKDLKLGELNEEMVATGKKIYEVKCIACHNISEKLIGPPQAGVLKRRSPEWVMNLMLNPEEMLKKDPIAIELLKEYNNIPMTNQQLTEEEARAILEFFRTI